MFGSLCSVGLFFFFFSSRRRHTRSTRDWSSDVCSSDLIVEADLPGRLPRQMQDSPAVAGEPVQRLRSRQVNLDELDARRHVGNVTAREIDRKSTRLNSSHEWNSYAVFCVKKKKRNISTT